MKGIIQISHFFIYVQWLVLGVSGALGYIALRLRLKAFENLNKVMRETFINSLLITGFIWKLSLILFDPVKFVNNPLSLMYFSGGIRGFLLAMVIAAAYLIYSSRKQGISVWIYADFIASGFFAGTMLYNIIASVLINQYLMFYGGRALLAALLLLWQIKRSRPVGKLGNLNQLLLWFSLGEIFISHFKGMEVNYDNFIWGFSLQQILFYVLAVFAAGANLVLGRKNRLIKN